jgi:hypothetical protein
MDRRVVRTCRFAAPLVLAAVALFLPSGLVADARAGSGDAVGGAVVLAHGDADWIKQGRYRDKDGDDCCGEDDCHPLSPAEVEEMPGGFNLLAFRRFVPHVEALQSEDGRYWACYTLFKFRCFFYPARRF